MRKNVIDLFFHELDRALQKRARVIVTGAAAGSLYGNIRPSADIDFEIRVARRRGSRNEANMAELIGEASSKAGLAVNYSDDIGHWSMIDYLDYRKTSKRYKSFGRLDVRLIAPDYWTIGKMARSMKLDIDDMVAVIRKQRLSANRLIALWARALRASPLSLDKGRFARNVENFLRGYGKKVWGKKFDTESALKSFRKRAGLGPSSTTPQS
ncbi:MAG TPA: hypothetical protein VKH64_06445 [Candidatus Binatia bacterium]|nr:hypothetical protein [Candidatus Binatia bacterium]